MNFGQAIQVLKSGGKVYRQGWNGVGMWLDLHVPDEHSKMTDAYVFIEYPINPKHHAHPYGFRGPWTPSQTDMLAEDWEVKPYE